MIPGQLQIGINPEGNIVIILHPDAYDHLLKELTQVSNELIAHCKTVQQKETLAKNAAVMITLSRQPSFREIVWKVQEQIKK